jgi:hypothetical protein
MCFATKSFDLMPQDPTRKTLDIMRTESETRICFDSDLSMSAPRMKSSPKPSAIELFEAKEAAEANAIIEEPSPDFLRMLVWIIPWNESPQMLMQVP